MGRSPEVMAREEPHVKRADERREPDYLAEGEWRWYDARTEAAFLPLALRQCSPQWPAHIAARHPRKVERRTGPRASRFNDLEQTR